MVLEVAKIGCGSGGIEEEEEVTEEEQVDEEDIAGAGAEDKVVHLVVVEGLVHQQRAFVCGQQLESFQVFLFNCISLFIGFFFILQGSC